MTHPDENGWMPIETAPKDGTKVDLWARFEGTEIFERVTDCSWQEMADWTGTEYMGWAGLWIHRHRVFTGPTHWRPLPPPPIAALSQDNNSLPLTPEAATPTDSANPPPVESVGPNSTGDA